MTSDAQLSRRAARFARHGGLIKGTHEIEGINSRMDGLQAAILNVKLPHLASWTKKRQEVADAYLSQLAGIGDLILPQVDARANHVWHLFVIRTKQRDALKSYLAENGIQTSSIIRLRCRFSMLMRIKKAIEDFPRRIDIKTIFFAASVS